MCLCVEQTGPVCSDTDSGHINEGTNSKKQITCPASLEQIKLVRIVQDSFPVLPTSQ
jgi:hypothetical protein